MDFGFCLVVQTHKYGAQTAGKEKRVSKFTHIKEATLSFQFPGPQRPALIIHYYNKCVKSFQGWTCNR